MRGFAASTATVGRQTVEGCEADKAASEEANNADGPGFFAVL
jgi:hypothetical protein